MTSILDILGLLTTPEESKKITIWNKGKTIPGFDKAIWRTDDYNNTMRYSDYGDRNSKYGWEFDHITPKALGGSNNDFNLRPLHHFSNASLGGALGSILK